MINHETDLYEIIEMALLYSLPVTGGLALYLALSWLVARLFS